jgi:DNA-binding NarL/FixJ family response regulator
LKALRVVVFSSSGAEADIEKAYRCGCHAFVTKPRDFTSLIKFVVAMGGEFFGMTELQWKGETPRFSQLTTLPAGSARRTDKS